MLLSRFGDELFCGVAAFDGNTPCHDLGFRRDTGWRLADTHDFQTRYRRPETGPERPGRLERIGLAAVFPLNPIHSDAADHSSLNFQLRSTPILAVLHPSFIVRVKADDLVLYSPRCRIRYSRSHRSVELAEMGLTGNSKRH